MSLSTVYKEKKTRFQKLNCPIKNVYRSKQRNLSRVNQMDIKYLRKCSTFTDIREMPIKTTYRVKLTLIRKTKMNNTSDRSQS